MALTFIEGMLGPFGSEALGTEAILEDECVLIAFPNAIWCAFMTRTRNTYDIGSVAPSATAP